MSYKDTRSICSFLSGVGFEPTPTYMDKKSLALKRQDKLLHLRPLGHPDIFELQEQCKIFHLKSNFQHYLESSTLQKITKKHYINARN